MKSMTIGNRIALICVVLVTLTLTLATASLINTTGLSARIHRLQGDSIPGQYTSGRLAVLTENVRGQMKDVLLDLAANSGRDIAQKERGLGAAQTKFQEEMKAYEKTITQAEDRQMFNTIAPAYDRYLQ